MRKVNEWIVDAVSTLLLSLSLLILLTLTKYFVGAQTFVPAPQPTAAASFGGRTTVTLATSAAKEKA
jgi:hypothetical protein